MLPAVLVNFEFNSNRTPIHIGSLILEHVQHAWLIVRSVLRQEAGNVFEGTHLPSAGS